MSLCVWPTKRKRRLINDLVLRENSSFFPLPIFDSEFLGQPPAQNCDVINSVETQNRAEQNRAQWIRAEQSGSAEQTVAVMPEGSLKCSDDPAAVPLTDNGPAASDATRVKFAPPKARDESGSIFSCRELRRMLDQIFVNSDKYLFISRK